MRGDSVEGANLGKAQAEACGDRVVCLAFFPIANTFSPGSVNLSSNGGERRYLSRCVAKGRLFEDQRPVDDIRAPCAEDSRYSQVVVIADIGKFDDQLLTVFGCYKKAAARFATGLEWHRGSCEIQRPVH
jgi:hypothetical protein